MAEQLTIFGSWEQVAPRPVEERPPPPTPPPPPPIDPRQVDLLSGPMPLRAKLELACEALDAAALREAHAALVQKFLGQRWTERAPEWAEGIEWLVGTKSAPLTAEGQVERARSLLDDGAARARFPEVTDYLLGRIRSGALHRAAARLTAEHGPGARLDDGRPAGYLLLLANDPALARAYFTAAEEVDTAPDARRLGYLGEAASRVGDETAALRAYATASLIDAAAIDAEALQCAPVLELLGEAEDRELPEAAINYLPALADLLGKLPLDDAALNPPPGAGYARRLAKLLRDYRRKRARRDFGQQARLAAKREMHVDAPEGLKELLRGL